MIARGLLVLSLRSLGFAQTLLMPDQSRPASFPPGAYSTLLADDFDGDDDRDILGCHDIATFWWSQPGGRLTQGHNVPFAWAKRWQQADIDGDGDRDFIAGPRHLDIPEILWLMRLDAGGNVTPLPTPLGTSAVAGVTFGDVDGDSDVDLVAGVVAQGVRLLRNSGGGTFAIDPGAIPALDPSLAYWPVMIDFDGDGDQDVLGVTRTSGTFLLRNTGSGAFVDHTAQLQQTSAGYRYAVGDEIDGDAFGDLLTLAASGRVEILWGGANAPSPPVQVLPGSGFRRLYVADVDGDGDRDVVGFLPDFFTVMRNHGARRLLAANSISGPLPLVGEGLADLNGDGAVDILVSFASMWASFTQCYYGGPTLRVDAAGTHGYTFLPSAFSTRQGAPAVGDVDGDGVEDSLSLLAGTVTFDLQVGRGADRFSSRLIQASGPLGAAFPRLGDVDGDRDLDVVYLDGTRAVRGLFNDGVGRFAAGFTLPGSAAPGRAPILGDLDGDGDAEVLLATATGVTVFDNLGGNQFSPRNIPLLGSSSGALVLLDVDGDRDLDLCTDFRDPAGALQVLGNDGSGRLTVRPGAAPAVPGAVDCFAAGDVDGDCDADQVMLLQNGPLALLVNDGSGRYSAAAPGAMPSAPASGGLLALADFDGDWDLDILAYSPVLGTEQRWFFLDNDGRGTFTHLGTSRLQVPSNWQPVGEIGVADFDGDGDVDVMLADFYGRSTLVNHLRQLVSYAQPRVGHGLEFDVYSAPGLAQPGTAFLFASFALASPAGATTPAGRIGLDLNHAWLLRVAPTDGSGITRIDVLLPANPLLIGCEIFFQHAVVTHLGNGFGVGNVVHEILLP